MRAQGYTEERAERGFGGSGLRRIFSHGILCSDRLGDGWGI